MSKIRAYVLEQQEAEDALNIPDLHLSKPCNTDRPLTYAEKLYPQPPYVWRPRMTGQKKIELEAYIKEHNLPF